MHLLVDISAHGYGHLAQTAPVLNALCARAPLRLSVRSALPRAVLAKRIDAEFAHSAAASDFGFAMHNAVDIDLDASARRYRDFHRDWPQRVATEAAWLRAQRVDAVLANAGYLPLAAAAEFGCPAVGMCSLNWADLFAHYYAAQAWAQPIYRQILAAYNSATAFLRITPGLPMDDFAARQIIGPIARLAPRQRAAIAAALDLDPQHRWVAITMGGIDFSIPIADWPQTPGLTWLVPHDWKVERADIRPFDRQPIDITPLLAGVDAVITKPGYGTFAEAACNGIPLLYLERPDWPETAHLVAWLAHHGRCAELTRAQLTSGDFIPQLEALWRQTAPPRPIVSGIDEAVAWLLRSFPGL